MILSGLYNLLINDPAIGDLIVEDGVHFTLLSKDIPLLPAIVIRRIHAQSPTTLDGAPALTDALFEFDAYANDQLTADKVMSAMQDLLEDFDGTLNTVDAGGNIVGTTDVHVYQVATRDLTYQAGGTTGWLFRSVLDVNMFFTESS